MRYVSFLLGNGDQLITAARRYYVNINMIILYHLIVELHSVFGWVQYERLITHQFKIYFKEVLVLWLC